MAVRSWDDVPDIPEDVARDLRLAFAFLNGFIVVEESGMRSWRYLDDTEEGEARHALARLLLSGIDSPDYLFPGIRCLLARLFEGCTSRSHKVQNARPRQLVIIRRGKSSAERDVLMTEDVADIIASDVPVESAIRIVAQRYGVDDATVYRARNKYSGKAIEQALIAKARWTQLNEDDD
jgi:hypothetical protein